MKKIETQELRNLINDANNQIQELTDSADINAVVEDFVTLLLDCEYASLWIFDKDSASLFRYRDDENAVKEISMLGQQGVLAKCFFTLSSGIFNHIASQKEYIAEVDNPDNIRIKSKIVVPIIEGENFLGIITAYSSVYKLKNFNEDDLEILEAIIPFLKNAIYKIKPEIKSNSNKNDVYISNNLNNQTDKIIEKVEEIKTNSSQDNKFVFDNQQIIDFVSNTVHDIRTPANTLYGFLELLESQIKDKRLLQYIHNAKESATFINDLTTSILDSISSQRESKTAKDEIINPTKFFANIVQSFSANMYDKQITFNVYIDPSIPQKVEIKSLLLKRVLMNLINNAYKFTPKGKSIDVHIGYKPQFHELKIVVSDTGIGIAPEKQKEIFEAFKQASDDTKLQYGGTGLGLAISADYVSQLGGELKLKSELDVGSSFYFSIPLNIINPQPMYQKLAISHIKLGIIYDKANVLSSRNILKYFMKDGLPKESVIPIRNIRNIPDGITHMICFQHLLSKDVIQAARENNIALLVVEEDFLSMTNKKQNDFIVISQYEYYADKLFEFISSNMPVRVLVADDDKINIQLLKAILRDEFCAIDTAIDGREALAKMKNALANENPYEVVFLDQHMPYLEGHQVLKAYKELESVSSHRVYAVTISGNVQHQSRELFDEQISKPFNRNAILLTIQKIQNKKR
jgi:signal transduction histidine kinase/CheY-like chemotaxis protein